MTESFFPGKFILPQIWVKRAQNGPKIKFFRIIWKMQNIIIDISPPISCLAKFWFSSHVSKCCWPIKLQDSLKCNTPRKKWMMKFIFGMQIDIEVFCKLILSFWVCIALHTQSTQNKKFPYIYNISRETWETKLVFCLSDKHKSFLQVDSIFSGVNSQTCPKYLK